MNDYLAQFGAVPVSQTEDTKWELNPWERIKESWEESVGSILGAGSMVADAMGLERGSEWMASKASDWFDKAASRDLEHQNFLDIENPIDAAKWVAELFVSYLPDLALMAIGGVGLGTGASKAAATQVGQKTIKNMMKVGFEKNRNLILKAAEEAGTEMTEREVMREAAKRTIKGGASLLGSSSVEGIQEAGNFYLKDKENRGEDANPFRSLGVGLGVSAIGMFSPITRGVAGAVATGLPERASKISLGKMFLGEFAEEAGQEGWTMLNEAGIDPNVSFGELVSSSEGQARLWESGIAGGVLGLGFGGAGKGLTRLVRGKEESTLENAGIDTSKDATYPDVSNITGLPVHTAEIPSSVPKGSIPVSPVTGLPTTERKAKLPDKVPLSTIMIGPITRMTEEGPIEIEMPANEVVKEADATIEKWYLIKGCLTT